MTATKPEIEHVEAPVARPSVVEPEAELHGSDAPEPHHDESKDAMTSTAPADLALTGEAPTGTIEESEATVAKAAEPEERSVHSSTFNGPEEVSTQQQPIRAEGDVINSRQSRIDDSLAQRVNTVPPRSQDVAESVKPVAGEAVGAPALSEETKATREEMSKISGREESSLMNQE